MPFDFKKYDEKCAAMGPEALQKEWEHYTRLISGAATSTTVSGLALPFTAGVSVIGVGMAAPAIHNARKKREIIERHLQRCNTTHNTRAKDVLGSMAFSGTLGVLTLGVGSMGADAIAAQGAEHGISAIVENDTVIKVGIHAALDGAAMAGEEAHHNHKKEKEANKMIAAARAKIAAAQAQGVYQGQPMGEKQYGYPTENVYGAVQIPGTYSTAPSPPNMVPQQPQFQDIKYAIPVVTEIKYDVPPTPAYTPAPPAYSPPAQQPMAPVPSYNPQNFAPPPQQYPELMSPTPSVSTLSSQASHPGQVFSPVSAVAPTPAPQQLPAYTPPPSAPIEQSQAAAHNLPPFQSHVAAPGAPAPQPQLVWSHVHNQWISQEVAPSQPAAPVMQQTAHPQEYPFPQQPVDRRASVYAPMATPAHISTTPAPQQPPAPIVAAPQPQQYATPTAAPHQYASPPQQPAQPPTVNAFGYPTPGATPGISQAPSHAVPYFPPPPGTQGAQGIPSYTPAPMQQTPAPQYAPVATPAPHTAPHRHSIAQSYTQPPLMSPPPSQHATPAPAPMQQQYYDHYQQAAPRHYSLPNPTPVLGQEKLHYAYQPSLQQHAIPEHTLAPQQGYHAPAHAASWGSQAQPAPASAPLVAPAPQYHPTPMQALTESYGGMTI